MNKLAAVIGFFIISTILVGIPFVTGICFMKGLVFLGICGGIISLAEIAILFVGFLSDNHYI